MRPTRAVQSRMQLRFHSSLVFVAALSACATASSPRLAPHLGAVHAVSSLVYGERSVAELDLDKSGAVDAADVALWDVLAKAAGDSLAQAGVTADVARVFYHGAGRPTPWTDAPVPEQPALFTLVQATVEGGPDLANVPRERLLELFVESRWLAGQARWAAGLKAAPTASVGGLVQSSLPGYSREVMEPKALCALAATADPAPFVAAGLVPAVVSDLDFTVWLGNASDTFLGVLAAKRVPLPERNPALQAFLKTVPGVDATQVDKNDVAANTRLVLDLATRKDIPPEQRVSQKDAFYKTVELLEGLDVATVAAAARATFEEGAPGFPAHAKLFYADQDGCRIRDAFATFEKRGFPVHILTAGLDVLGVEAGRQMGLPPERVVASRLEVVNGKYTGKVADTAFYSKGPIARQWLGAPPYIVFGDSPSSDLPMMRESTGTSFMVNPRPELLKKDDEVAGGRFVSITFDATELDAKAAP